MADLSVAVLVGRLTRDAELKFTNSGQAICHFSVATGTRRKKGDQWVDEPSFWDVDLWGKQAESLNQYLTKGKQVAVEGQMRQERWEHEGSTRMKVVVNANAVQLLGGGREAAADSQSTDKQPERKSPYNPDGSQRPAKSAPDADMFSDDIPF
jgi:single-strand DNA-binding protein